MLNNEKTSVEAPVDTENQVLLETKNLKKYFPVKNGMLHAVDDVSLTINRKETLGIVGESGCGKSTIGRTVLRLLEPTGGQVLYNGMDLCSLDKNQMKKIRTDLQLVFQDPYASLNPRLSVSELIAEPLIVTKSCEGGKEGIQKRVNEMMDIIGLASRLKDTYPHELDGGRRQRIGIARALVLDPKFIVCDEPVSALDVSIQAQILNLLMDLQRDMGLTYMFITHDLSVVKHISNNIAVMYLGQCVELAEAKELFRNPIHPYTKALLAAIPVPTVSKERVKKEIIRGEVTSPINPKPGCRFYARCPYASPECVEANIPLSSRGGNHKVACIKF